MAECMEQALKLVNFGISRSNMCNLFMVNEAEAAAVYALTSEFHDLKVCTILFAFQASLISLARRDFHSS